MKNVEGTYYWKEKRNVTVNGNESCETYEIVKESVKGKGGVWGKGRRGEVGEEDEADDEAAAAMREKARAAAAATTRRRLRCRRRLRLWRRRLQCGIRR